jgi:uncharacterized protein with ParB-like and HNH nuclease domain
MINNANQYTISDIFSASKAIKYIIPKYQREYAWNKSNWEDLLGDLLDDDRGHFIGSIICIKSEGIDVLSTQELELVDGQQRLTTISLLFCAIYKILKNKIGKENYEIQNLKYQLVQKSNQQSELKLELSRQNNNNDDYRSVLGEELGIFNFDRDVRNKGNRKIYKAYRYFCNRLEDYNEEELREVLIKLNSMVVVKIEVNSHSDAFMLFESLNNRGIPLSAIDLIKNKILSEMERTDNNLDASFEKWQKIILNLSDDYTIQERFLRQFYNAFKFKSEIRVERETKATKSSLIRIYQEIISRNPVFILDELMKKSEIYKELLNENGNNELFVKLDKELKDLINVKAAPSYTFLLYIFSLKQKKELEFYKDLINFIVKYFVRRNITDFPNTSNLDKIFIDLISGIESNEIKLEMEDIIGFISRKDRMASDKLFEERLRDDVYDINVDMARFVLTKIEETRFTREMRDLWDRDSSGKLVWTVEHVFPEGKNIPQPWIDMIANGNKENAKQIQIECVHKFGNLTLTGYNSNLSNLDFIIKRDRVDRRGNFIGYKNGLYLNEELRNMDHWKKEDIEKRTDDLVNKVLDIFKI